MKNHDRLLKALGIVIRKHREKNEMSQHQLASAAKVTAAFICYLENNERSICLKTLDRICQVLNVPISSILLEAEQLMIMGRDK